MMAQYLFSIVTWMLFFVLIENYMGERPLAVTNIVRSFYTILTIPSHALGSVASTLVSNTIGAGRRGEVLNLIKRIALVSLGVMVCVIAVVSAFPRMMIRVYTDNPSLISDTVLPLYVLISSLPIFSIGMVLFNAVSGTGNTRTTLKFEVITLFFYLLYMWFVIIYMRFSVAVAWTTEHVYWLSLAALSFSYLRSGKWKGREI
jgi:Na+-driven multidrug efflux pump